MLWGWLWRSGSWKPGLLSTSSAFHFLHFPLNFYPLVSIIFIIILSSPYCYRVRQSSNARYAFTQRCTHVSVRVRPLAKAKRQTGQTGLLCFSLPTGFDTIATARIFHKLMNRLGFKEYYLQGGDWGSRITTNMAQMLPQ